MQDPPDAPDSAPGKTRPNGGKKDVTQQGDKAVIGQDGIETLISALRDAGYQVIGPRAMDGAIVYEPLQSAADLPVGMTDEQEGGQYRLVKGRDGALFDYVVGPHSWKRYLYPPKQRLWRAQKAASGASFRILREEEDPQPYAFLGVRACEMQAMQIQDKVFDNGDFADPGYLKRRAASFSVAVNCSRAAATCFCTSMDCGPRVGSGADLILTEILEAGGRHDFVVEAGSPRGAEILGKLGGRPAEAADTQAAEAVSEAAEAHMSRHMVEGVAELLQRNIEHPQWRKVAERCLNCANCTMVCPTCFCTTVEDTTDLTGENAERWRKWDSCFTLDFSYIHGGAMRRESASRYRQWMTHKLSNWHDQFGLSGCTGCGRCITWCPVGIDITEEARAIRDSEGKA